MLHVITDFYEAANTKDIQFLYDLYYLFILNATRTTLSDLRCGH